MTFELGFQAILRHFSEQYGCYAAKNVIPSGTVDTIVFCPLSTPKICSLERKPHSKRLIALLKVLRTSRSSVPRSLQLRLQFAYPTLQEQQVCHGSVRWHLIGPYPTHPWIALGRLRQSYNQLRLQFLFRGPITTRMGILDLLSKGFEFIPPCLILFRLAPRYFVGILV